MSLSEETLVYSRISNPRSSENSLNLDNNNLKLELEIDVHNVEKAIAASKQTNDRGDEYEPLACKLLQVDISSKKERVKEGIINRLETDLSTCRKYVRQSNLIPSYIVRRNSRGLALQGKLLCERELRDTTQFTVQVKNDLKFSALSFAENVERCTFRTKFELNEFKRKLKLKSSMNGNSSEKELFFAILSVYRIKHAMWEPILQDLKLSNSLLGHLKDIEKCLLTEKEQEARVLCKKLFEVFGSHFYTGKYYYGGLYAIETLYESNGCTDKEETSTAIELLHKMKESEVLFKDCVNHDGEIAETQTGNKTDPGVKQSCIILGGPESVSMFPLWKRILDSNNRTWEVIDIGECALGCYIGIWVLVNLQRASFIDSSQLSSFLSQEWNTLFASPQSDLALELISKNCDTMSYDFNARSPESYICLSKLIRTHLLGVQNLVGKSKTYTKHMKICKKISSFLVNMTETEYNNMHIHCLLPAVYFLLEEAGNSIEDNVRETAGKWIEKNMWPRRNILEIEITADVEDWLNFLKGNYRKCLVLILDKENRKNTCDETLAKAFTSELEQSVEKLFRTLAKKGEHTEYLCLVALLLPLGYDLPQGKFFSAVDLTIFQEFILNALRKLMVYKQNKSRNTIECEASMIRMIIFGLLKYGNKKKGQSFKELFSIILLKLQKDIKLSTEVEQLIRRSDDLSDLIQTLSGLTGAFWTYFELKKHFPDDILPMDTPFPKRDDGLNSVPEHMSHLLKEMRISNSFPGKMSLQTVLQLRDDIFKEPSSMSDFPWILLRKIIAINFEFREKVLDDLLRKLNKENIEKDPQRQKGGRLRLVKASKSSKPLFDYHPLDVFLSLFHCFDPFLKKLIVEKMAVCQFAIPFIYQQYNEDAKAVSVWPLREIFLGGSSEAVSSSYLKSIAFIRIGPHLRSKSQIINKLIRGQNDEHSTFFHKDCPLGQNPRKLYNGVVEVSWFFPSNNNEKETNTRSASEQDKPLKSFPCPFTILNLRGDAYDFGEQTEAILTMSNVIVLFIKADCLIQTQYKSILLKIAEKKIPFIIVTEVGEDEELIENVEETLEFVGVDDTLTKILQVSEFGKELNESEIKQLLTEEISDSILKTDRCTCIEEVVNGLPKGIHIDEESPACFRGKLYCEKVFSLVEKEENIFGENDIKMQIVPLQAEGLWQEWSKKQKEIRRSGKKENPHSRVLKMKNIRIDQIEHCNIASDAMAMFVDVLSRETDDETTQYFLVFFKQEMDHQSRHVLPKLNQELYAAFQKYQQDKTKNKEKRDDKIMKENEECLLKAESKLAKASFGLEHFFRELGQVYESFVYSKEDTRCEIYDNTNKYISDLPKHAARVLLLGQPLEIMDGDAANVPLKWIDAVLMELEKEIGQDKKLFSVSVLGIQSSGKSTLLNTMFGLHFAVSAGRCTRGIFMQLVKVDKQNSQLPFDYAMIIDTEGLRAPELSGQKVHHDNELATLVTGIGDVSIMNIKGETIAEMADVIQIVVHALLRLMQATVINSTPGKNVLNLTQSSVFVHQNVSAQNASKQMLQGNQKIVQCLDEMTREVAEDEQMEHITAFQDVINFDPLKHVIYISDLWRGSPPMAPASPEYSVKVQEVTKCILEEIAVTQSHMTSIHDTRVHVKNLWEGILNENFVFSFRNVLEVKAFGNLETKFQTLVWKLENLKLTWIENRVTPDFVKCTNVNSIEQCSFILVNTYITELNKETKDVTDELEEFFEKAQLKEHMIHWKGRKLAEIEMVSKTISSDISSKIEREKDHCKKFLKSSDDLTNLKKSINEKAIDYAEQFKSNKSSSEPNELEIDVEFQKMWSKWIDELAPEKTAAERNEKKAQIQAEMISIIYDKLHKHESLVTCGLEEKPIQDGDDLIRLHNSILPNQIKPEFLTQRGRVEQIVRAVLLRNVENFQNKAHTKIKELFTDIDKHLEKAEEKKIDYEKSQFSIILNLIQDFFSKHNIDRKIHGYAMTPPFQVMIVLHISRHAYKKFIAMSTQYAISHSLRAQISTHKKEIQTLFVGLCTAKANALIVTDIICGELVSLIKDRTVRQLAVVVPDKVINSIGHTKWNLIEKIMVDLANKGKFDRYMYYIKSTKNFVMDWIVSYTNDLMNSIHSGSETVYMNCVSVFIPVVLQQIQEATKEASDSNPRNMEEWTTKFKEKEKSGLMLSDPFTSASIFKITDFEDLSTLINTRLEKEKDAIREECYKTPFADIEWGENSVYKTTVDAIWKCKENCPWCAEPCMTTSQNDTHRCLQHRPQGIAGITWSRDGTLVCNTCTYEVRSESTSHQICGSWCGCPKSDCTTFHKCTEFHKYMKNWEIKASFDMSKSTYWAWFMWNFRTELVQYYNAKMPSFPTGWNRISKTEAIKSLEQYNS